MLQYFISQEAKDKGVQFQPPRPLDAGFDVAASEDYVLKPGEIKAISTGLHIAVPENWVAVVKDRSSMALKGVHALAGVIDASYRGEVKVVLKNLGDNDYEVSTGNRIAQFLLLPHSPGNECIEVSDLDSLGNTERGAGGFGSTGS